MNFQDKKYIVEIVQGQFTNICWYWTVIRPLATTKLLSSLDRIQKEEVYFFSPEPTSPTSSIANTERREVFAN